MSRAPDGSAWQLGFWRPVRLCETNLFGMSERERYPQPGPLGGRLIREVIALLREAGVVLPLSTRVAVAVSGGADSVALAHLLVHFGRRVVPRDLISIVHVDHGWRGEASTQDAQWVQQRAQAWGVTFEGHRLASPDPSSGESLEAVAREARRAIFEDWAQKHEGVVMTAHHAEDLAETLLWRLCTGTASTQGGGIAVRTQTLLRPLLKIRKAALQAYLEEVGESHRIDITNQDSRFLRNRLRQEVFPALERIFPRAIERLSEQAWAAQRGLASEVAPSEISEPEALNALFGIAAVRPRRAQWEVLSRALETPAWTGQVELPGAWTLRRENPERWILEASPQKKHEAHKPS